MKWFNAIENKKRSNFIQYDIVEFYPSISDNLLTDALQWAEQFTEIPDKTKKIVKQVQNLSS